MSATAPESATCVVIGAGVIGCAVARVLAAAGKFPIVLEKGPRIAEGTTARNSGVIHAGIYYSPGSLKAESCIRGNALLYEWCQKHSIPHRRVGKWIVGSRNEEEVLAETFQNALSSGASALRWAKANELQESLQGVRAEIGIFSENTGIVDPYELSRSLQHTAEEQGAFFATNTEVTGISRIGAAYRIETSRGPIDAETVVNAAGLHADEIARLAGIDQYRIYPCRGDYFRLKFPQIFPYLLYPVKPRGAPGLGVHLTIGLDGSLRLGPNTTYVDSKTNFAHPENIELLRSKFLESALKYLPGISLKDLTYDSCGIRPKLRSPSESEERDFVISEDLPGFINLMGIESPGLTASLDIAERVGRIFT